jgi:hypothetical protein
MWMVVVFGLAIFGLFGTGCDGDDMSNLFRGVDQGKIGGSQEVPAAGALAIAPNGLGLEKGIVTFRSAEGDDDPQLITATLFARFRDAFTGPLVGIAEWGSGDGATQRVEFDLPIVGVPSGNSQSASGVSLSVPATSLQIKARNDAALLVRASDNPLGDGGLGTVAIITASLAAGNRAGSGRLTRTMYNRKAPAASGLAPAASVLIPLSPFATSFQIFRASAAQTISFAPADFGGTAIDGPYNVAANAKAPEMPIPQGTVWILVTNTGAAEILTLGVQYFLFL